jgi:splicing factor 1
MSWRNQGITGSNNIPLGKNRLGSHDDGLRPSEKPSYGAPEGPKRGRSPERGKKLPNQHDEHKTDNSLVDPSGPRQRKKRNRWGDAEENKAAGLMGLPTMIMANMTNEQLEAYTLHLRIEEISQKLRINDVVPADGDR